MTNIACVNCNLKKISHKEVSIQPSQNNLKKTWHSKWTIVLGWRENYIRKAQMNKEVTYSCTTQCRRLTNFCIEVRHSWDTVGHKFDCQRFYFLEVILHETCASHCLLYSCLNMRICEVLLFHIELQELSWLIVDSFPFGGRDYVKDSWKLCEDKVLSRLRWSRNNSVSEQNGIFITLVVQPLWHLQQHPVAKLS